MMVQFVQPQTWLLEKVNRKRKSLIEVASTKELTGERVVVCNQELDRLLNLLQQGQRLHHSDHESTINRNQGEKREKRWVF